MPASTLAREVGAKVARSGRHYTGSNRPAREAVRAAAAAGAIWQPQGTAGGDGAPASGREGTHSSPSRGLPAADDRGPPPGAPPNGLVWEAAGDSAGRRAKKRGVEKVHCAECMCAAAEMNHQLARRCRSAPGRRRYTVHSRRAAPSNI